MRLFLLVAALLFGLCESHARTVLTGNTTYHINPDTGSDANNGLTTGTAFATPQKCWDNAADTLDMAGFNITCLSAAGKTYTNSGVLTSKCQLGQKNTEAFTFDYNGSTTTRNDGLFNWMTGDRVTGEPAVCTRFAIKGATITASNGGGLYVGGGHVMGLTSLNFGAASLTHVTVVFGQATLKNNYTVSGGAQLHFDAQGGNGIIVAQVLTVTCTGSPAFGGAYNTGWASPSYLGQVFAGQVTYSGCGSVTGNRFSGITGGLTWAGANPSPTYFPGSVAGKLFGNAIYGSASANPQLLEVLTANNSATLDWVDAFLMPKYDAYMFVFENLVPVTNAVKFLMRVTQDSGSSWLNANYLDANLNTNGIYITSGNVDNTAGGGMSGQAYISGVNQTDRKKVVSSRNVITLSAGTAGINNGGGWYNGNNNAVNGFRFMQSSGNISTGKVYIIGLPTR